MSEFIGTWYVVEPWLSLRDPVAYKNIIRERFAKAAAEVGAKIVSVKRGNSEYGGKIIRTLVLTCVREGDSLCDDEGCPHYGTPHVCVEKPAPVPALNLHDACKREQFAENAKSEPANNPCRLEPAPAADDLVATLIKVGDYELKHLPPDMQPGPDDKPPYTLWHIAAARITADAAVIAGKDAVIQEDGETIADLMAKMEAAEARMSEVQAALTPFAVIAGPIKGEAGRPTYLEVLIGKEGADELFLTCPTGTGSTETLYADDFRKALAALNATGGGNS